MNLLILHLSDIHIVSKEDDVLQRGDAIGQATFRDLSLADVVAIVITGDVAYSGKADQFEAAMDLLAAISATIKSQGDIPIHVLVCPGNHDCDFDAGTPDVRNAVIETIRKSKPDDIKPTLIDACTEVQENFFNFRRQCETDPGATVDKLWATYEIPVGCKTVVVHCVNVAWMSQRKEPAAAILFPTERYEGIARVDADTTILCMHHPLNWFAQPSYRSFRRLVRRSSHLILTGHEHIQSAANLDEADSGESVSIDGGVLQESGSSDSRFNTILVDLDRQEYSVAFYEWDDEKYVPMELEAAWSSFRKLPEKTRSEFELTAEFSRWLSDAGARFTHRNKAGRPTELQLEDIYVFPELRPFSDDERDRLVIDSSKFRNPSSLTGGVLVKGREHFGKTSLLKQLFRNYHERGYVPVLLSGRDIAKPTSRELQKTVEAAVANSYGPGDARTKFWQAGVEKRVLLLDDLDETRLSGSFLSRAVEYFQGVFGLQVITANELFDLREMIVSKGHDVLSKFDHYEILEFGYRRRLELIKKWANLSETNYSLDRLVSVIDHAEKIATGVIGEGVVPSTPFFLLTILQSVEAGSIGTLQQSALGDYYRYLIIHALEVQGVARDEHGEILNYGSFEFRVG